MSNSRPNGANAGSLYPTNNDELIITEVCGKTKIFHEVHDCHDGKCFGGYNKHANVLAFRYGFIPYEYYNAKRPRFAAFNDAKAYNNAKLLTHIPDCANTDVFKPIPWEKKRKGAVLFGMVWYMLYPLREVVSDGIKAKVINATKFKHPGYNMPYDKKLPSPLMYDRKNPEIAVSIKVQEEYAKLLAETKICIFDSSIAKKAGIIKSSKCSNIFHFSEKIYGSFYGRLCGGF